ncbi:MAG TPA: hypothetical protein VHB01_01720 [Nitrosospira sp.]|nr:hypothetical protein [Nitrosospira sp.]
MIRSTGPLPAILIVFQARNTLVRVRVSGMGRGHRQARRPPSAELRRGAGMRASQAITAG